jgi:hypothetical protein
MQACTVAYNQSYIFTVAINIATVAEFKRLPSMEIKFATNTKSKARWLGMASPV